MTTTRLLFALAALSLTASASETAPHGADGAPGDTTVEALPTGSVERASATPRATTRSKPLPFAPELSDRPAIMAPSAWNMDHDNRGWAPLAAATPASRQAARWAYANYHIGLGHGPEAFAALDVMRQDEPDLSLVPSFQLAVGASLALLNRPAEALAALSEEALLSNPEACAWRILALASDRLGGSALGQLKCALPALNARPVKERGRFLIAAADVAEAVGNAAAVLQLLAVMPASDTQANLLRGRAQINLGKRAQGLLTLARAKRSGNTEQQLNAEITEIEEGAANAPLSGDALVRLRHIQFVWRGGDIERRALRLIFTAAQRAHDLRGTLEAGATLFRYHSGGEDRLAVLAQLRETLAGTLAPDSRMPLDQVAGLYWDYRDLSPAGAEGDLLVTQLADRLQAAALYDRAAELLDHQLRARTRDVAQGPLSARVASLFILAGKPKRALSALRDTEGNSYPEDMIFARHRVEAVALEQLGRTNEALAVLQDVPDGQAIRDELLWRRRDWQLIADAAPPTAAKPNTDVMQARILRHAVALAMLGREGDLARLRAQYGAIFAKLPTAPAFDALTAAVETVDPAKISAAMTAIPAASPAGGIADLLDAAPQQATK